MFFDYAHATAGQTVLIHGAAGNVGAYAVQLARNAGLHVIATASSRDTDYVRRLGAERVLDYKTTHFEEELTAVDVIVDTVGGSVRERSCRVLKPDGILISVVSPIPKGFEERFDVKAIFFLAEVTTTRLNIITKLFESRKLVTQVGYRIAIRGCAYCARDVGWSTSRAWKNRFENYSLI